MYFYTDHQKLANLDCQTLKFVNFANLECKMLHPIIKPLESNSPLK